MRLNEKQQMLVLIGVFALCIIGEGVFGYFCYAERGERIVTLDKLDKEEQDAQKKIKQIPELKSKSQELAAIIEEYAQILPSDREVRDEAFLEEIYEFLRGTGVKVLGVTPEAIVEKKDNKKSEKTVKVKSNFVRHKYRFEMEGTFLGLLKFINLMENHVRFLRVDSFEVKPLGSKDKQNDAQLAENEVKSISLVISTYTYSKPTPTPPSAEEAK
ncbi:MAG: hypothetical protein L0Z55_04210 [Planctomycetes bacterium]|nr:hypothetical protein [Planctomycetota bacterium]